MSLPLHTYEIQTIEHFYIPLSSGTKLASRMWLPKNSLSRLVPVILEYIPYRKRDATRGRDDPMSWYAGHGYAVIRVDIRGSGEPDGYLDDEYLKLKQKRCDFGNQILSKEKHNHS